MRAYTLLQLKTLRDIRLKSFDKNEMLDDVHTNEYHSFEFETDLFFEWLEKMEKQNKIDYLLLIKK